MTTTANDQVKEAVSVSPVLAGKADSVDGKIKISPRAKLLAEEKKIDFTHLNGTGPNGRIIVRDIEIALSLRKALLLPVACRLTPGFLISHCPMSGK